MTSLKTRAAYPTTYHRDGTVTVWDVYHRGWVRTNKPSDALLASLSSEERARVERHVAKASA